jgi:hypothetical protein
VSGWRSGRLHLLLLLGAPCWLGCDGAKELRAQQSAGGVLLALGVLREAPNQAKAKALSGLAQAPCNGEGVCEVRDACRAAYALHVEALTLTAAAKQKLTDGQAQLAAALLGPAEEKLKAASAKIEDCNERAGALRRRYKL